MKTFARLTCALVLTVIFTSCATTITRLEPFDGDADAKGTTAMLISYELTQKECELQVKNLADGQLYDFPLEERAGYALVKAPQGGYQATQLSCANYKTWELRKFLRDPAELQKGKTTYLGHVRFVSENEGKDLTIDFGDRKNDTTKLIALQGKLPAGVKKNLVTASTHKPIRSEMLSADQDFQLKLKFTKVTGSAGGESGDVGTDSLSKALAACDLEEQKEYTLRLGHMKWRATYEKSKPIQLEKLINQHAFSDRLERCFEGALDRFQLTGLDKLIVDLEL